MSKQTFDRVTIACGVFNWPHFPNFPGLKQYSKPYYHSMQVRKTAAFKDKTLHVIGGMYSGSEIIEQAILAGVKKIYWTIHRRPNDARNVWIEGSKSDVNGETYGKRFAWDECTLSRLGITHPTLEGLIPGRPKMAREIIGGYKDGKVVEYEPATDRANLFYHNKAVAEWFKSGLVELVGPVQRFDKDSAITFSGEKVTSDLVIMATGFDTRVKFLEETWRFDHEVGLYHFSLPVDMKELEGIGFVGRV